MIDWRDFWIRFNFDFSSKIKENFPFNTENCFSQYCKKSCVCAFFMLCDINHGTHSVTPQWKKQSHIESLNLIAFDAKCSVCEWKSREYIFFFSFSLKFNQARTNCSASEPCSVNALSLSGRCYVWCLNHIIVNAMRVGNSYLEDTSHISEHELVRRNTPILCL